MTVYLRKGSDLYYYDFQLDGHRYSGPTLTSDRAAAALIEQAARNDILGVSSFGRSIIRRAMRDIPATTRFGNGFVYVLQSGYFIKIGHSNDPAERIKTITTASPEDCELLFCVPGGISLERRLHHEFAACHHRREWFFLCGKLKQFVAEFRRSQASADAANPTKAPRLRFSTPANAPILGD